jgi:hypothetical protein
VQSRQQAALAGPAARRAELAEQSGCAGHERDATESTTADACDGCSWHPSWSALAVDRSGVPVGEESHGQQELRCFLGSLLSILIGVCLQAAGTISVGDVNSVDPTEGVYPSRGDLQVSTPALVVPFQTSLQLPSRSTTLGTPRLGSQIKQPPTLAAV